MARRTQNFVFTLYGDYLQARGGEAWVGSLIELMDCFDISAQAARSTLSRMSSRGWFQIRQSGRNSYYSLTSKGVALLEEGRERIFHPRADPWDGRWLILVDRVDEKRRHLRSRLRERLVWLGFGLFNQSTWISPRDRRRQVEAMLDDLKIRPCVEMFYGAHPSFNPDRQIVERCWNTKALNRSYVEFMGRYEPEYKALVANPELHNPRDDFARRFMLIHEYRLLPYVDPNLPPELLSEDWLGDKAVDLFQKYHGLLTERAEAFVVDVIAKAPTNGAS